MSAFTTSLAQRVLAGEPLSRDDAERALALPASDLLDLMYAAYRVRSAHHGRSVRIHILQNAKSGICPEDCSFCSQSLKFKADVPRYGMQTADELVRAAEHAHARGAATYCMVTATRGPTKSELETVCEATRRIKSKFSIRVCASLGMLDATGAERLAAAGVDRFNHNLETSRRHYPEVVSTHTFDDRIATVRAARSAGMEACSGGIIGLGETVDDRIDLAFELAALGVESIPINFLNPRPGTPLGDTPRVSALDALKSLAVFRFANPTADVRVAGGREEVLGAMTPLALYAATSIFADGYLTTDGDPTRATRQMIEAHGFEVISD